MNKRQRIRQKVIKINNDGLINMLSGLNTVKDPSSANRVVPSRYIRPEDGGSLFIDNGTFRKIITAPADEALRAGFEIKEGCQTSECNDGLQDILESLSAEEIFSTAMYWHRAYGGGAIFMQFDGGGDIGEPLDENNLNKVIGVKVYTPIEVNPMIKQMDPTKSDYMRVINYIINDQETGASFTVDASRLILFPGETVPGRVRQERNGWGGTVLEFIYDQLINKYDCANSYSVKMIERLSQGVLKINGMMSNSSSDPEAVRQYLNAIDLTRNILNTLAIDSLDDFDLKSMSLAGLDGMMEKYQTALSAVCEIPVTILFGRSPGGQNATGDSDFEQWYSFVQRLQRRILKPRMHRFIDLVGLCKQYNLTLPASWSIDFCPLSIPSEKEQAETNNLNAIAENNTATARNTYVTMGALDSVEVRGKLDDEGEYELDRSLDGAANEPPDMTGGSVT